jgi:hypothetical protein
VEQTGTADGAWSFWAFFVLPLLALLPIYTFVLPLLAPSVSRNSDNEIARYNTKVFLLYPSTVLPAVYIIVALLRFLWRLHQQRLQARRDAGLQAGESPLVKWGIHKKNSIKRWLQAQDMIVIGGRLAFLYDVGSDTLMLYSLRESIDWFLPMLVIVLMPMLASTVLNYR